MAPVKPTVREQRRAELAENYKKRRQRRREKALSRPPLVDPGFLDKVRAAVAGKASAAVGYTRVSTDLQADSPDLQRRTIEQYAALKGFALAGVVVDVDVSGSTAFHTREGGAIVLEGLALGVKHVIATRLDRVFRSVEDCLHQTTKWTEAGVAVHFIDLGGQAFDTASPLGRFFLTIMAAAAELERNIIRDRIKKALADLRQRGLRSGVLPYGWKVTEGNRLARHPQEQAVIAWILAARKRGYSYNRIATELTVYEMPSRGKRWHSTTIKRIVERAQEEPK